MPKIILFPVTKLVLGGYFRQLEKLAGVVAIAGSARLAGWRFNMRALI